MKKRFAYPGETIVSDATLIWFTADNSLVNVHKSSRKVGDWRHLKEAGSAREARNDNEAWQEGWLKPGKAQDHVTSTLTRQKETAAVSDSLGQKGDRWQGQARSSSGGEERELARHQCADT